MSRFTKYGGDDFVHRSFLDIASRTMHENAGRFGVGGGVTGLGLGALGGEVYGDRDRHTLSGAGIGLALGVGGGVAAAYNLKPRANQYTRGVVKAYETSLEPLWDSTNNEALKNLSNLSPEIQSSQEAFNQYVTDQYIKNQKQKASYFSSTYQPNAMQLGKQIAAKEDRKNIYRFVPDIVG